MVFKFIPQTQLERTANFASRPSTTVQSGASDHLQERSNKIIPNYSDKDVCSILYYWPLIFFLENECVSYHILWPLAQFCLFELATAFHIQNSIEVLPNAELLLNYQLFHWLQGRGFHFGTPGTPPPPGRGNSCKAEAVEDKLTLSEIYLVHFGAQFPDGFGILRSFQMAQKNAAGIGAASKLLLEFEERERIAAELSSSWKDVGRRFVSPLRREGSKRRDAIWVSMGWIEEWAGSEWSNQPGGAWKIIGREARWHQQPPACCSTKISKTQGFGYRCSLSKSKIATTPKLSLVCPPSPFYIQTWRARLFPSQNSPINFFCNFIFFLISGRGQLWREVVRKENEVSGHPPLPPYLNSIAFVSEPHSGWPWGGRPTGCKWPKLRLIAKVLKCLQNIPGAPPSVPLSLASVGREAGV